MKFSLWPSNERTPADLLDQARTADETDWNLGRDKSQRADRLARIKAEVFDRLS